MYIPQGKRMLPGNEVAVHITKLQPYVCPCTMYSPLCCNIYSDVKLLLPHTINVCGPLHVVSTVILNGLSVTTACVLPYQNCLLVTYICRWPPDELRIAQCPHDSIKSNWTLLLLTKTKYSLRCKGKQNTTVL